MNKTMQLVPAKMEGGAPRRLFRLRRPPLLLYSHIANELLAPFFASFLILYSVFFLVRLIPMLEVILALHIGMADFLRLTAYIFPHMLLYIIPMASMGGVIIGFTRLTNDREILAFKSCGISLKQMLPPVILCVVAIACLTGLFSIRLIPIGDLGVKQLMFQLAKEKIDKGLKAREFTEALGDIVIYVDAIDDQQHWQGVFVSDMRGRTQPLITVAKSGVLEADMKQMLVTITLNDGTLHSNEGVDNQLIRFNRYQLRISLQPPTQIGKEDVTELGRGAMTQEQLVSTAAKQAPDSKAARVYLSEYHHRLVLPVGCFILSLLGMPIGMQAGPGKRAVGLPLGLFAFLLYYITLTITRVLSEDGKLPLVLGLWLPNMLFFALTVYVFWRVNQERSLLPEHLHALLRRLYHRFVMSMYSPVMAWVRGQMRHLLGWKSSLVAKSVHLASAGRIATFLTKLLVSALILYLIVRSLDLRAITAVATAIPALILVAALGLQVASNCVAAARWSLIMNKIGITAPFSLYLKSFFKGAFFNQGLPASIGGDGLRILDAARISSTKEDAVFGVFIDRVIGLSGLLLLNLGALLFNHSLLPSSVYFPLLAVMSLLLLGLITLFFLHRLPIFCRQNVFGYLGRLSVRYHQVYASVQAIGLQTLFSVCTHLLSMAAFACLGYGVGMHYPLSVYLALIPPVVLLTTLPISLAGWGIREGAVVGFFLLIGADKSAVLSASILYGLVNLIASLPGLLVYLMQKKRI
jgi:lipopolysaccharide export system permease protein